MSSAEPAPDSDLVKQPNSEKDVLSQDLNLAEKDHMDIPVDGSRDIAIIAHATESLVSYARIEYNIFVSFI